MQKWRVYNVHRDGLTHKEKFRGEEIVIPPGGFVLMDYEDAVLFKGQYYPMQFDGMNQQTPESMKMIKIEADSEDAVVPVKMKFVCQRDGKEFESQAQLDAYTKAQFGDEVFVDEVVEQEIKKSKKK